jgi:hypothetical protein
MQKPLTLGVAAISCAAFFNTATPAAAKNYAYCRRRHNHATVRIRYIGGMPDVVRTRLRLLLESVPRQCRRSICLRAGCPQDVRLRTASLEKGRARSRGRDEE